MAVKEGEMKAEQHELDLIHREGYEYHARARRGWYYKGQWVGYNVKDAFAHRAKREEGKV